MHIIQKPKAFVIVMIIFFCSGSLSADTIELADGALLEGDFVGSSNGIIMFDTGEGLEAFLHAEVVAVYLSDGIAAAEELVAERAQPPLVMEVPAGTRLVIRTTDEVNSSRNGAGHRFRGQLEGALVVNGITIAPRGTVVYGRITQASQAGRVGGSSNLSIEFSDIMIDDQLFPIATGEIRAKGANEAGRTAGRTARAAVIGGLIGGSKGARTGAAVGIGASLLTSGASINIPRGTILETSLRTPLFVPQQ